MESLQHDKHSIFQLLDEGKLAIADIPLHFKNDAEFMLELWSLIKEIFPEKDYNFTTLTTVFLDNIGPNLSLHFINTDKKTEINELSKKIDICFENLILQKELTESLNKQHKKLKI